MLNLKDYGSSSDEGEPSESVPSSELSLGSSIDVKELSKMYAVNAAPDVLPPVSFQNIFFYILLVNFNFYRLQRLSIVTLW